MWIEDTDGSGSFLVEVPADHLFAVPRIGDVAEMTTAMRQRGCPAGL